MGWLRGGPLRLDGDNIRQAVDASLLRLGTDRIDLLQLHWPDRCGLLVDVPPASLRGGAGMCRCLET